MIFPSVNMEVCHVFTDSFQKSFSNESPEPYNFFSSFYIFSLANGFEMIIAIAGTYCELTKDLMWTIKITLGFPYRMIGMFQRGCKQLQQDHKQMYQ